TLKLTEGTTVEVTARVEWTFPPAFAEVVWGDGGRVWRRRVDLSEEGAFSGKVLRVPVDLKGAKWVRLEGWDVAANGAFTQPVWGRGRRRPRRRPAGAGPARGASGGSPPTRRPHVPCASFAFYEPARAGRVQAAWARAGRQRLRKGCRG